MAKLTIKDARHIANQVFPGVKLECDATPAGITIFRGTTGQDGLEIVIQNDWVSHDGKIHMTITEPMGGRLERIFEAHTLKRDLEAEDRARLAQARQARVEWVQSLGDMAHDLVDRYLKEG